MLPRRWFVSKSVRSSFSRSSELDRRTRSKRPCGSRITCWNCSAVSPSNPGDLIVDFADSSLPPLAIRSPSRRSSVASARRRVVPSPRTLAASWLRAPPDPPPMPLRGEPPTPPTGSRRAGRGRSGRCVLPLSPGHVAVEGVAERRRAGRSCLLRWGPWMRKRPSSTSGSKSISTSSAYGPRAQKARRCGFTRRPPCRRLRSAFLSTVCCVSVASGPRTARTQNRRVRSSGPMPLRTARCDVAAASRHASVGLVLEHDRVGKSAAAGGAWPAAVDPSR